MHLDDGSLRRLIGQLVFLNVGTHAAVPAIPGLKAARPLTHIEALELDHLPPHLIVLGSGYVGLEMAQAYRRFGSRVTIIEAGPRILGREDRDIAETVQQILSDEGIQLSWRLRPSGVGTLGRGDRHNGADSPGRTDH